MRIRGSLSPYGSGMGKINSVCTGLHWQDPILRAIHTKYIRDKIVKLKRNLDLSVIAWLHQLSQNRVNTIQILRWRQRRGNILVNIIDGRIMQGRCHLKMGWLDLFDPPVLTHLSSIHIPWSYVRLPSRSGVSCPGSIYLWSPSRLVRFVWNTNIRLQHIQVNGSPTPTLLSTLQLFLRINDS